MTTHERNYGLGDDSTVHEAVGAYVLGILDEAEATAFEAHLAGCHVCAVHLEEFSGMEPMLALLADNPDPFGSLAPPGSPLSPGATAPMASVTPLRQVPTPAVSVQPGPQMFDRLVDEVAVKRAKRKRRGFYLVAAAAALIIGGPVATVVATTGSDSGSSNLASPRTADPAAELKAMEDKVSATDPSTKVSGTVGMEEKAWGTFTALELSNVTGPQKCSLIAVSSSGEEEVVTTWSVPKWGYGIPGSTHEEGKKPLYVQGGTAMSKADIDHFEVRTFDGKRLVEIGA
ncbi:anti-sigma U factor RsuA [Streptomyces hebeiensis]|uniref:Anti-sigma U factor RsuA n=1 Tax=Streptomyces hebeiensis TaxID=229486 RepID=A0ABN1V077_9ACTN